MIVKFGWKGELLGRGPAEEVAREDARPCGLGVDTQVAPVIRMGADLAVLDVQVTLGGVCDEPGPEPVGAPRRWAG